MITVGGKEPILKDYLPLETGRGKQLAGRLVVAIDIGIELMEMQHIASIQLKGGEGGKTIALMAPLPTNDDAYFGTQMLGSEVLQIDETDGGAFGILNDEPHLFVGIDIACGLCQIVVQGKARIGHIGGADVPKLTIVFYLIEQIKVFRLQGAEHDLRLLLRAVHRNISLGVIMVFVSG